MKIMYVNCEYINEYRSNPRINEHCLSISENKVQIPFKRRAVFKVYDVSITFFIVYFNLFILWLNISE